MSAFSIILPHKRNPGNDKALSICLDMLMANTVNDYTLLMDAACDQPLVPRINRLVSHAPDDICVYWASDTFAGPRWDVAMLDSYAPTRFVTGVLIEPGMISMDGQNYHRDFGRRADTFNRADFERAVLADEIPMLQGKGWVAPYMFNRARWLDMGGLNESLTSPDGFTGADRDLFDKWEAVGNAIIRAQSYAYHLQRWSDVEEQEAEKRR